MSEHTCTGYKPAFDEVPNSICVCGMAANYHRATPPVETPPPITEGREAREVWVVRRLHKPDAVCKTRGDAEQMAQYPQSITHYREVGPAPSAEAVEWLRSHLNIAHRPTREAARSLLSYISGQQAPK